MDRDSYIKIGLTHTQIISLLQTCNPIVTTFKFWDPFPSWKTGNRGICGNSKITYIDLSHIVKSEILLSIVPLPKGLVTHPPTVMASDPTIVPSGGHEIEPALRFQSCLYFTQPLCWIPSGLPSHLLIIQGLICLVTFSFIQIPKYLLCGHHNCRL